LLGKSRTTKKGGLCTRERFHKKNLIATPGRHRSSREKGRKLDRINRSAFPAAGENQRGGRDLTEKKGKAPSPACRRGGVPTGGRRMTKKRPFLQHWEEKLAHRRAHRKRAFFLGESERRIKSKTKRESQQPATEP